MLGTGTYHGSTGTIKLTLHSVLIRLKGLAMGWNGDKGFASHLGFENVLGILCFY